MELQDQHNTQRNARVAARWDDLTREGKHGHYETLFQVVREEIDRAAKSGVGITDEMVRVNFKQDLVQDAVHCFQTWAGTGPQHGGNVHSLFQRVFDRWEPEIRSEVAASIRGWRPVTEAKRGQPYLVWKANTKEHYVAALIDGGHGPGWCSADGHELFKVSHIHDLPSPPPTSDGGGE